MLRIIIRVCAFVARCSHTMISFLEGKIEYLVDKFVILSAGGIVYKVSIVPNLLNILSKSQAGVNPERSREGTQRASTSYGVNTVKMFIHSQLNMREGTFDLYGFDKKEDLDLFNTLISVSGIGPKNALNIMSSVEPRHLKAAVINDDADFLKKVSGLGPKTAQRLILELKNKIDYLEDVDGLDLGQEGHAMDALLALGYSANQAKDVLKEAKGETLENRVRDALKILGKK